jgi:hypothetical protein
LRQPERGLVEAGALLRAPRVETVEPPADRDHRGGIRCDRRVSLSRIDFAVAAEVLARSGRHTSETRRRADAPSVGRRQFGRHSLLIVGNRNRLALGWLPNGPSPEQVQIEQTRNAARSLIQRRLLKKKSLSRTTVKGSD